MYLLIKYFFDFIVSITAIIILLPFSAPIMILLRFTSEGEIFYLQDRVGLKNKKFKIWKFATMLKNSSKMKGGYLTTINDYRFTFFGSFLRKTKINELPQLINILLGEMSFVGPRPVMKVSFDSYPKQIKNIIYNVKPGLTGIGSIIFRDEERLITNITNQGKDPINFYKKKIYPYKGELEIWYQNNQSFLTDCKLIMVTIWVVFFPKSSIHEKFFKTLPKKSF